MPGHILPHSHGESMNTEHILHVISQTDNFQTVAESFKILEIRPVSVFSRMLCHCEECVINISAMMDMSSPAVSHHLRQFKSAGLIVSRREEKEVYYKAADTEQSRLLHIMIEQVLKSPVRGTDRSPRIFHFISFLFDF